jgi:hypothetical protein
MAISDIEIMEFAINSVLSTYILCLALIFVAKGPVFLFWASAFVHHDLSDVFSFGEDHE